MMRVRFLVILALAALVTASSAQADLKIVAKTTVVHVDEAQPQTLESFLAAVPVAVRHEGADVLQNLLVADRPDLAPNAHLLQDWAKVSGGQKSRALVLVGKVSPDAEKLLAAGLAGATVTRVDGDPVQISSRLARTSWEKAGRVVVAPHVASPTQDDFVGLANAAVVASIEGCPLLLVGPEGPTADTLATLRALGTTSAVIVDVTKRMTDATLAPLQAGGVKIESALADLKTVVARVNASTDSSTICLAENPAMGLAATIAAARYKGVVLKFPEGITSAAKRAVSQIPRLLLTSIEKLPGPYVDDEGGDDSESWQPDPLTGIAKKFYDYIQPLGADNPSRLETVITFAQGDLNKGIPLTFERALVGDPRHPTDKGALPSRMPGSAVENIAYVNRSTLYRALAFAAPRPKRVTMLMVAYEAENVGADCSYEFTDWENKAHKVNEFYGTHEGGYDDPGAYEMLSKRSYSIGFHNGRSQGAGEDPINHEKAYGFWKEVKDGTMFFYDSSHGGGEEFYPEGTDKGIDADLPWGSPYWPSSEGRVNNYGDGYGSSDIDRDFGSVHSMLAIFNACLMANGKINKTLLDHGAVGSISSYTSVSFDGAGMYNCYFVDRMTQDGTSIGEAFAYATARTSQCFARGQEKGDGSLRFVLFGDPKVEFVKPSWTPLVPLPAVR